MYSDPYRGSYHLRSLAEAEILSSRHYRGMTSAPRHGSNYIIQARNTPAGAAAPEAPPLSLSSPRRFFCTPAICVLHSAILCFFFNPHPDSPPPLWLVPLLAPRPSPLKDNATEHNRFDCLVGFGQRVSRCRTFWQVGGGEGPGLPCTRQALDIIAEGPQGLTAAHPTHGL